MTSRRRRGQSPEPSSARRAAASACVPRIVGTHVDEILQLGVTGRLGGDQQVVGLGLGPQQLVELALGDELLAVLGVLDSEEHDDGDGRRRRVEADLPPVREPVNTPSTPQAPSTPATVTPADAFDDQVPSEWRTWLLREPWNRHVVSSADGDRGPGDAAPSSRSSASRLDGGGDGSPITRRHYPEACGSKPRDG